MKRMLACLLLLVIGCGGDPDEQANKLFVEAVQLIESAESKSDEDAIKDYEQALSNVQRIIDDYSESDLAVKLISGETLFTGKTLADIKIRLTELKKSRAVTVIEMLDVPFEKDDEGNILFLSLFDTSVTDAQLEHITGMTSLRRLELHKTQITDAGLVHLKGLTKLETLLLLKTQITDEGILHLKGLTSLKSLWLTNSSFPNTKVTDAGVADLQKALPDCRVSH